MAYYYKSYLLLFYLLLSSTLGSETLAKAVLIKEYPHNAMFFTQGLIIHNQQLTETTGLYGQSALYQYKLGDQQENKKLALNNHYFGEGLSLHNNKLYWLTWKAGKVNVINTNNWQIEQVLTYKGQGWGLTSDNRYLIMSNGSHELQFKNPQTFTTEKTIAVFYQQKPLKNLNELEWVNGYILANIWHKDAIAKIDPDNGKVVAMYPLAFLRRVMNSPRAGALNGIAYDSEHEKLYISGKNWPSLFEIKLSD